MYYSEQYEGKSDEQLIEEIRLGHEDIEGYLLEKYKNLVRKKARAMFLVGGDNDDLIQEGMIGLYKAIRDYDRSKESSFYYFADICITRQLYTAVQASLRMKHIPLNSYVSIYDPENQSGHLVSYGETMPALQNKNPEELLIDKERVLQLHEKIKQCLSDYEQEVLNWYMEGYSYQQIAEKLGKTSKSVDNALQRIKGKLV